MDPGSNILINFKVSLQQGKLVKILQNLFNEENCVSVQTTKPLFLDRSHRVIKKFTFEDFFLKLLDMLFSLGNLHETNNGGRGYTTFSGFRIR